MTHSFPKLRSSDLMAVGAGRRFQADELLDRAVDAVEELLLALDAVRQAAVLLGQGAVVRAGEAPPEGAESDRHCEHDQGSDDDGGGGVGGEWRLGHRRFDFLQDPPGRADRKSKRLNSSHYCASSMP